MAIFVSVWRLRWECISKRLKEQMSKKGQRFDFRVVCNPVFHVLFWSFLGVTPDLLEGTTYTVTSNTDPTSANPPNTTLRGAMLQAVDGDIIVIQLISGTTITLTNPLPVVTKNITIQGSGGVYTIDGASNYQIFSVAIGTLTLQDLQINHGLSKGGDAVS